MLRQDIKFGHCKECISSAWLRQEWQCGYPQTTQAQPSAPLFCQPACQFDRVGSLRRGALLGQGIDQAGTQCPLDKPAVGQAIRQGQQACPELAEGNDANDAEAACEGVSRPNMRFVPLKSVLNSKISRCCTGYGAGWHIRCPLFCSR
jgi:hypothetical protein